MHGDDARAEDAQGNVSTIDLTERRALLLAQYNGVPSAAPRGPQSRTHGRSVATGRGRPGPQARLTPRVVPAPRVMPARGPLVPRQPVVQRAAADPADLHWRPPGRHRAPKLAVVRRRGWPWSIGVDAVIALLVLATLAMAVDVLM